MSAAVAVAAPSRSASGGRTRITANALKRVVAAVAGDALGVHANRADTRVTDHGAALDVTVHVPISVISISRHRDDPRALARTGGSVMERCAAAETSIRDRVHSLTGYSIRRVTVQLTAVTVQQERRVR